MPQNHHYVPVFYLKRWVGKDGRLCVYIRPRPHDDVKAYWKHPDATGYMEDLYAISGAGDETANHLEGRFLNRADNDAAEALDMLETGRMASMDSRQRSSWSRFMMRLLHGTPEAVSRFTSQVAEHVAALEDKFRANYASLRGPTDLETYEDRGSDEEHLARTTVRTLQTVMDSKHLGNYLNGMAWDVVPLRSSYSLLTSDRPLLMTNGIRGPGKHLAMPIGPRLLFIAADDPAEVQRLAQQDHDALAKVTNDRVVRQARGFVWGLDDTQLRFVERRLGDMLPSSPLEA
jgi:hypothetical protein